MKQFRYVVSNSAGDIVTTPDNNFEPQIRRDNIHAENHDWYQRELKELETSLDTLKAVKDYAVANANMAMTTQHYISMSSNNGYGNVVMEVVTFNVK